MKTIVNGSLNKHLTFDMMVGLELEEKRTVLFYLHSGFNYEGYNSDYAKETFYKIEQMYDYKDIQAMNDNELNNAIQSCMTALENRNRKRKIDSIKLWREQGEKILKAQTDLGFTGELYMELPKLDGYIHAIGQWNDFYPEKIMPFLYHIDKICPRVDCGVNNPNTGNKMHKWAVNNDYIYLVVDFCTNDVAEKWEKFFRTEVLTGKSRIMCDSIRFELQPHQNDYCGFYISFWWD